nr:MAG TPA: hypothetical protein [Caudoviricetes sp.]
MVRSERRWRTEKFNTVAEKSCAENDMAAI